MNHKNIKVLIFCINDEYYATDIMEVERILGYEIPTSLPDVPCFVEGVINHEGSILPIINIAKKFKLDGQELKTGDAKIIVAKQENNKMGIIVNLVSEVSDIELDSIDNPPEIVSHISKKYIRGLIKKEGKIIIFLNLLNILSDEEKDLILK